MRRIQHVALLVDPAQLRDFHVQLALRLSSEIADRVTITRGRSRYPIPAAVDLLFELERLTQGTGAIRLPRRVGLNSFPLEETSSQERPNLLIDFCGQEVPAADRVVRVLYDGLQSETAAIGALVDGRMPTIAIEDASTGAQVASGIPCADNAGSVSGAFECVLARAVTLLLAGVRSGFQTAGTVARSPAGELRLHALAAFQAKAMAHAVVRHLYRLCFYTPHWRCCWRFIDGPDVWATRTLSGAPWNIVPDTGFRFYADPFPFEHRGRSYLFVEGSRPPARQGDHFGAAVRRKRTYRTRTAGPRRALAPVISAPDRARRSGLDNTRELAEPVHRPLSGSTISEQMGSRIRSRGKYRGERRHRHSARWPLLDVCRNPRWRRLLVGHAVDFLCERSSRPVGRSSAQSDPRRSGDGAAGGGDGRARRQVVAPGAGLHGRLRHRHWARGSHPAGPGRI